MSYPVSYLIQAHTVVTSNKSEIKKSEKCGCFYCMQVYSATEITDWIDDTGGDTARCPNCDIDAVIPSSTGYPIDDIIFLQKMRKYWF